MLDVFLLQSMFSKYASDGMGSMPVERDSSTYANYWVETEPTDNTTMTTPTNEWMKTMSLSERTDIVPENDTNYCKIQMPAHKWMDTVPKYTVKPTLHAYESLAGLPEGEWVDTYMHADDRIDTSPADEWGLTMPLKEMGDSLPSAGSLTASSGLAKVYVCNCDDSNLHSYVLAREALFMVL